MDSSEDKMKQEAETKAYLSRIQRTISESKALMSQVELRMAETDRLLASQGLTREQVANMRFSDEQKKAVNNELRRRGLPQVDFEEPHDEQPAAQLNGQAEVGSYADDNSKENLENRRRKFNVMMNRFKL